MNDKLWFGILDQSQAMTIEDLYKITEADEKRAANVLAAKGKIPNLMSNGASKSKKGGSKKTKPKKKKAKKSR